MSNRKGAISHQILIGLRDAKQIEGAMNNNIAPASVDLQLSDRIYVVQHTALPKHDETVETMLQVMDATELELTKPDNGEDPYYLIEKGKKYLVESKEIFNLHHRYYGYCNPKSSTGRLDTHVRVIANCTSRFDTVPKGYSGALWILIEPKSFSLRVRPGDTMTQLRLFNADTRFDEDDIVVEFSQHGLAWLPDGSRQYELSELRRLDEDGSLMLTLALPENGPFGYRCIAEREDELDLRSRNVDPRDFFKEVRVKDGVARLRRNRFYILSCAERIRIPPHLAAEMVPMDDRNGEFRSHYAGFLDPGWGWGEKGEGVGRPFTLEVRTFEDLLIRPGQPIAKIKFERMAEVPRVQYDGIDSNYLEQEGPRLGKQFAPWPA